MFVAGIAIYCYFAVERVPITGRRQLDLIPQWLAVRMEKSKREEEEVLRENIKDCLWHSDHPGMQAVNLVFSRLVRTSGLDDRDWDLRVVRAPGE